MSGAGARRHFAATALLALLSVAPALAEDAVPASFSLKGFGTFGLARSDDGDAEYVRDLSQAYGVDNDWSSKIDSMIGVQASLALDARNELVLQAVSRYRYDHGFGPELSWAYWRHELNPAWHLRIGRMGTEFYMLADSRMIGYANLTVRPPPDVYGQLVFSYFDGADIAGTQAIGSLLLRTKLFAGWSAENSPLEGRQSWHLKHSPMLGGHLDLLTGPWQLRLSQASVRFSQEVPLDKLADLDVFALAPELSVEDTWSHHSALGIVYDSGPLQLHGMLNRIAHTGESYEDARAAYLLAAYRLGSLTPYLGYSRVRSSPVRLHSPMPAPARELLYTLTRQTHSDQHTWTIGARWDFARNLALKAQLDHVDGNPDSLFPLRQENPRWDGQLNLFSLALEFLF